MSTERRLRRRARIAWSPEVRARIAIWVARGYSLADAAAQLKPPVPERTVRQWSAAHEWPRWIEIASDLVARDPAARTEVLAQHLLDEAARVGVERKEPTTRADVERTRGTAERLARSIARRRGLEEAAVVQLAQPKIPEGANAEQADQLWTERLLRLLSLSVAPDLSVEEALVDNRMIAGPAPVEETA